MFDNIDEVVKLAIFHLMLVLHRYGVEQIHMGGLMRLLGVENKIARGFDEEIIIMDRTTTKYIEQQMHELVKGVPTDQTLH